MRAKSAVIHASETFHLFSACLQVTGSYLCTASVGHHRTLTEGKLSGDILSKPAQSDSALRARGDLQTKV